MKPKKSVLFLQVVGLAFLVLGLWLRFSEGTREIFRFEDLNSSAFVIGWSMSFLKARLPLVCPHLTAAVCRCDRADTSRRGHAGRGSVWRLRCVQREKMCPADGEICFLFATYFSFVQIAPL